MKIQGISSQSFSLKQSKPAFKAVEVVTNDDFDKLVDFAAKRPETTRQLMVALKMLELKNKDSKIQYNTAPGGEINIRNLQTGRMITKINEYNHSSQGANLDSFVRFASPSDEQHQRLLGSGLNRNQSEELKDIATLAVNDDVMKNPIYKEIKELETQKYEKTKELIRSMIFTA